MKKQREDYEQCLLTVNHLTSQLDAAMIVRTVFSLLDILIFFLLCPALAERNGSQSTGEPWDQRLAGHTSATHTFLVFV